MTKRAASIPDLSISKNDGETTHQQIALSHNPIEYGQANTKKHRIEISPDPVSAYRQKHPHYFVSEIPLSKEVSYYEHDSVVEPMINLKNSKLSQRKGTLKDESMISK